MNMYDDAPRHVPQHPETAFFLIFNRQDGADASR